MWTADTPWDVYRTPKEEMEELDKDCLWCKYANIDTSVHEMGVWCSLIEDEVGYDGHCRKYSEREWEDA